MPPSLCASASLRENSIGRLEIPIRSFTEQTLELEGHHGGGHLRYGETSQADYRIHI